MSKLPLDMNEEDDEPTAPFWMATFSDMVTLLLAFFVMIVAMSEVEVKKFKEALSHFNGHSGVLQSDMIIATGRPVDGEEREKKETHLSKEHAEKYEELLRYLREHDLEEKVQVSLTEHGLHVVITDSVMFESGEAYLIAPSRTILALLARLIDETLGSVTVEGHTDDRPIRTSRYPSNWELSTARAASVVRFMLERNSQLPPSRYVAIGYGEHQPVAPNTTAGERAKNRRVEIFISWEPWQKTPHRSIRETVTPQPQT